jgi:transcriptional regulator with XRE-family HTH domain
MNARRFSVPRSEPREVLRSLMEQHGLKQSDLGDLIAQPNLSAILNGHRAISENLAKGLAQRFNVAVDVSETRGSDACQWPAIALNPASRSAIRSAGASNPMLTRIN